MVAYFTRGQMFFLMLTIYTSQRADVFIVGIGLVVACIATTGDR